MLFHRETASSQPIAIRESRLPLDTIIHQFSCFTCRVPNGSPAGPSTFEPDVAAMFDDYRHVPDRTQQIRIVEQVVPTHVQPRVPTELPKARHRAPHLSLALIEGKKRTKLNRAPRTPAACSRSSSLSETRSSTIPMPR